MKKRIFTLCLVGFLISFSPSLVSAHVVVKPSSVTIGSYQTFTVGVPVESTSPITAVRLVIPKGVTGVTPNVKPGWTINSDVTQIIWTGGSIPQGLRDEFSFSAKVPNSETSLAWKAYVTSKDGMVAAWDALPTAEKGMNMDDDMGKGGPYSVTTVLPKASPLPTVQPQTSPQLDTLTLSVTIVALVFSLIAFSRTSGSRVY